jgi:hypothetical protein
LTPSPVIVARRVQETDQTEQYKIVRQVRRTEVPRLDARILQPGQSQHALPLCCESVRILHEAVPVDGRDFSALRLLSVAMIENDLRSSFDQEHLLACGILVQRGHEFVFRLERDGVDTGIRGPLDLPFQPDLSAERIERALGRIAFHLPDPVLL